MESCLSQLKQAYEPYKAQEDLNAINKYFPMMKEQMRIVGVCEQIGLTFDSIRSLLFGKTLSGDSVQLKIEKEPDNPGKLRLSLNGQNIMDWFKQKYQELRQAVRPHIKPTTPTQKKGRGV